MVRDCLAVFSPARDSSAGSAAHDAPAGGAVVDGGNLPRVARALAPGCGISTREACRQPLCAPDSGLFAQTPGEALACRALRGIGNKAAAGRISARSGWCAR